ncbi:MAG TPA: YceI family protein [Chloroflexia bacterium]|nr:YceI family protein [Chloroflexia bacterium]
MAWKVDSVHSAIEFAVKHMMVSTARGRFEKFDITVDLDEGQPELAAITAVIDAASINTREEKRDAHLRSADFFNVEKYPTITFKSTKVTQEGPDNFTIAGDLTMLDITHPVVFKAHSEGQSKHPWAGHQVWGFSAETTINRKDWGLSYNMALETGGFMVADQIKITLDVELAQEAAVALAAATA